MRLLYIFLLLSIHYTAFSQCTADFTVTSDNFDFQFTDASTVADGDTISSRIWKFGDGFTSLEENPSHSYINGGVYQCILQFSTTQGCNAADTMIIEVCGIDLDFNLATVCNQEGNIALTLKVTDLYNSVSIINVYLDDLAISDTAIIMEQSVLNLNLMVPGDGNQHFVRVESALSGLCDETIGFFVEDCNSSCFLSDLDIDQTFSQEHNIVVLDGAFMPNNRIINLGELVRFIWLDDQHSSTSEDTISIDKWDSGVQDSSYILELELKNPGLKPFFSTPDGGPNGTMTGNIIANCPATQGSNIQVNFINADIPETGFYLGIDGIILKDTVYQYSPIGLTTVTLFLPGDNKNHQILVIDVDDPSCSLKQNVRSINCQGVLDCALNINAAIIDRCDQDSMVQLAVAVNTLKASEAGVLLILDDTLVMDTLYYENLKATTTISLAGDGLVHKLFAMDLTDSSCIDEILIEVSDCSQPCSISELKVGTGSNNTIVLAVTNNNVSLKNINIASGDDILWQWVEDSIVGLRSEALSGSDSWDSGLLGNGSIFISPILTAGIHPYYMYNSSGDTLFSGSINVIANCDENQIPVFYQFDDVNGSTLGYDIYVDDIRITKGPFDYALDGFNKGIFQIEGDDQEHIIEIRDLSSSGCSDNVNFVAPMCEITPCGGMIQLSVLDSCYNNNTVRYVVKVSHPDPSPQGFILLLDGELFEGFPFLYNDDGEAYFDGFLPADSSVYTFSYVDLLDPNCFDSLNYQSSICITECSLSHISSEILDDNYLVEYPNTPDSLIGCQDSFIYVAVRFSEKYTDASQYFIFLDSVLINEPFTYQSGDTINTAIFKIIGDSSFHTIQIIDALDIDCSITTEIFTPFCYSPCDILISNISLDSCANEIAYYTVQLDSTTNSIGYQVYYDGDSLDIAPDSLSFQIQAKADGLNHSILIIDKLEPLCRDSIEFTIAYCLECPIDISVTVLDSCTVGDSIGYALLFNNALDSLGLEVQFQDSLFTIIPAEMDYTYFVRHRGDSSSYQYVFTSLEDAFCTDTIELQTVDCTPIFCDVDYTHFIDGFTLFFGDNSNTSEPIIHQSWTINDIVTINNVSNFNYTVDSIGIYQLCHSITTDSCTNEICRQIMVGDPCTLVIPFFSVEKISDGYQFTNMSTGQIDDYLYRFGDGIFSNSINPFHVYDETGVYEACLIVRQDEFSCEKQFCLNIDVIVSDNDISNEKILNIYPNPLSREYKEFYINYSGSPLTEDRVAFVDSYGTKITFKEVVQLETSRYKITLPENLTNGIYFVIISDGASTITRKIAVY